MQFAKRVVLNALTRKQNRNKTPELPQAPIPSPLYHGFSCFSGWAEMRPGPSLCTRPTAFHLLHDNNTPLSLSLVIFISSLSTEMFPLAHKHTINPSHKKKKNKAYLDSLCSLQVPLLFSLLVTHVHKNHLKQSSALTVSRSLLSNPAAARLSFPPQPHWICSDQVNEDLLLPNSSPNLIWQQRLAQAIALLL